MANIKNHATIRVVSFLYTIKITSSKLCALCSTALLLCALRSLLYTLSLSALRSLLYALCSIALSLYRPIALSYKLYCSLALLLSALCSLLSALFYLISYILYLISHSSLPTVAVAIDFLRFLTLLPKPSKTLNVAINKP